MIEKFLPSPGQQYRHYKGAHYEVTDVTMETETGRLMVQYRDLRTRNGFSRWMQNATNPETGEPSGWLDPLPDGRTRFTLVGIR